MIIQLMHDTKKMYVEFEDEVLTPMHLQKLEENFTKALNMKNIETFHFHTHNLRIPHISLSLAFGRFMMRIQKHMHCKSTFIEAPSRVRNFLKFFFAIYRPTSKIVWL